MLTFKYSKGFCIVSLAQNLYLGSSWIIQAIVSIAMLNLAPEAQNESVPGPGKMHFLIFHIVALRLTFN